MPIAAIINGPMRAADILAQLLTVDGTGSLLDSDLLDGQEGSYYLDLANATGNLPFSQISGTVDADLLEGQAGSYYLDLANATGTLAVANGGTGATSFTANQILYGNGTSALTSSANLTFNGSTLAVTGAVTATSGITCTGANAFVLGGIFQTSSSATASGNFPICIFKNTDTTNDNGCGFRFVGTAPDTTEVSGANILCQFTSKSGASLNGKLLFNTSNAGVDGTRLTINANGDSVFSSSTAATAATAAALVVTGGVGATSAYIGGETNFAGKWTLTASGSANAYTKIENTDAASFAKVEMLSGTTLVTQYAFGQSYTTSGQYIQAGFLFEAQGAGGLGFATTNASASVYFYTNGGNKRLEITSAGSVVVGSSALATTATDGFHYVPTCAGTPTGTPTSYTGRSPIVIDSTNNKLYFYSGGSWRDAGP